MTAACLGTDQTSRGWPQRTRTQKPHGALAAAEVVAVQAQPLALVPVVVHASPMDLRPPTGN